MSEEAKGRSGPIIGSVGYFDALHQGKRMAQILPNPSGYAYSEGISVLAKKAKETLSSIYEDLCTREEILRYIPADRRSRLGELVGELDSIYQLSGGFDNTASSCQGLLGAAFFSSGSMATDRERSTAEELLSGGGESGLSPFERVSLLREVSLWGMAFAAGGNVAKETFLKELNQIHSGSTFLEEIWTAQRYRESPWEFCGQNGYELGSEAYIKDLEEQVISGGFLGTDLAGQIRAELEEIYREMEADIITNLSANNYITDELGDEVEAALRELSGCGSMQADALLPEVKKLCWYTPIDPAKVRRLQELLNQLELGEKLQEDGVYGYKTSNAVQSVCQKTQEMEAQEGNTLDILNTMLLNSAGSLATLIVRGADIHNMTEEGTYPNKSMGTRRTYRVHSRKKVPITTLNPDYVQISQKAQKLLNQCEDLKRLGKSMGNALSVLGGIPELIAMVETIQADTRDADGKIGRQSVSAGGAFAGYLSGGIAAAKVGKTIVKLTRLGTPAGWASIILFEVVAPYLFPSAGKWLGEKAGDFVADLWEGIQEWEFDEARIK